MPALEAALCLWVTHGRREEEHIWSLRAKVSGSGGWWSQWVAREVGRVSGDSLISFSFFFFGGGL